MTNKSIDVIRKRIEGSLAAIESLRDHVDDISQIADLIIERIQTGGVLYTCGNGGSAAQALHLAEELIGRYRATRPPIRAICLNADPTAITCIANDFGFDQIFSRQCEALLKPGDVLLTLSTSGNSPNIIAALKCAKAKEALAIGLLGKGGGACRDLCDHSITIAGHSDSAFIQDAHHVIMHLICEAIERAVCKNENG